ncbi:unnamed protein product [Calypogeia fissa]
MMSQESVTMQLSSGHTLGYAVHGPSSGFPIFFPHGFPSSRLEACWLSKAAHKVGVKFIAPDRPGIGLSTRDPNRTLLQFPNLISQLATHWVLSNLVSSAALEEAHIPFACAKVLPPSQLVSVGIVAGFGPPSLGFEGMSVGNKFLLGLQWCPSLIQKLMEWTFMRSARNPDPEVFRAESEKAVEVFEKDAIEGGELFQACVGGAREHWRQGRGGFVDDGRVVVAPWGFELEDVEFEGVQLFYGTADTKTPVSIGRQIAARLKKAVLTEYEGETHMSIVDHTEDMLRKLVVERK